MCQKAEQKSMSNGSCSHFPRELNKGVKTQGKGEGRLGKAVLGEGKSKCISATNRRLTVITVNTSGNL